MVKAAKLLIVDSKENYLLLERSNHPRFGNDPDLPGGTVEEGETQLQAMIREVFEEAGITINPEKVVELYSGTSYSKHGSEYSLYRTQVVDRPEVRLSWEHTSYQWVKRSDFLSAIKDSPDTYMGMVYDVVSKEPTQQ